MWSLLRGACLVAFWLCSACAPKPDHAPPYLVGVWETRAEGYTDRQMFIDQRRIGFGTSAVTTNGYVITKIDERREAGKPLFVFSYQGADRAKFQLSFFYESAGGGRITFKNQDHLIWTKKEATT